MPRSSSRLSQLAAATTRTIRTASLTSRRHSRWACRSGPQTASASGTPCRGARFETSYSPASPTCSQSAQLRDQLRRRRRRRPLSHHCPRRLSRLQRHFRPHRQAQHSRRPCCPRYFRQNPRPLIRVSRSRAPGTASQSTWNPMSTRATSASATALRATPPSPASH